MKGTYIFILIVINFVDWSYQDPIDHTTLNATEDIETTATEDEDGENSSNENAEEGLQTSDPNTISFYLYPDPENQSYYEELQLGNPESFSSSSYSPEKSPMFLIHGFTNNFTCRFSQGVKNALLSAGFGEKHNIIVVDWGAMSSPQNQTNLGAKPLNDLVKNPYYRKAVSNVPIVGKRMADFIYFMYSENYIESPADVYLLGFSLGAQVSGCAGYEVKQYNSSMPLGRITVDSSDAEFVDVIHTNKGQSGYDGNIGHVDFYPNGGGPNQSDCVGNSSGVDNVSGSCAHSRAWQYYNKALQNEIYGCKCYATASITCKINCQKLLFGYGTPTTGRGMYYLDIFIKE